MANTNLTSTRAILAIAVGAALFGMAALWLGSEGRSTGMSAAQLRAAFWGDDLIAARAALAEAL
jgi:hypothetical protein